MDSSYNKYSDNIGVTYSSPIFGPIRSRRLGLSLGINLLPSDGKICSFDCIYCECGLNSNRRSTMPMPNRKQVYDALESKLYEMSVNGELPDVITFAGNGEPTLNPHFRDIVNDVCNLRSIYCPDAKVTVLSNSTQIHKKDVKEALLMVDNAIMKLDTVNQDYIKMVDQPNGNYDVKYIIDQLKNFKGKIIIQTMFIKGTLPNGTSVDNTSEEFINSYIQALLHISPKQVMIYTIDRLTPISTLEKVDAKTLDYIADQIKIRTGFNVSVSY